MLTSNIIMCKRFPYIVGPVEHKPSRNQRPCSLEYSYYSPLCLICHLSSLFQMSVPFFPAFYVSLFFPWLSNQCASALWTYFAVNNVNNVLISCYPHSSPALMATHHTAPLLILPIPPLNVCRLAIQTFPDAPARVLIASFPCVAHALDNGSVFRITHTKISFIRSSRQCCRLFLTFLNSIPLVFWDRKRWWHLWLKLTIWTLPDCKLWKRIEILLYDPIFKLHCITQSSRGFGRMSVRQMFQFHSN